LRRTFFSGNIRALSNVRLHFHGASPFNGSSSGVDIVV
jgi:hypothetical protein